MNRFARTLFTLLAAGILAGFGGTAIAAAGAADPQASEATSGAFDWE